MLCRRCASAGSCSVDGKPWVHHKKPKLAEVVDVMQQIRRARKGVKETADVDPAVAKKVIEMYLSPLASSPRPLRHTNIWSTIGF